MLTVRENNAPIKRNIALRKIGGIEAIVWEPKGEPIRFGGGSVSNRPINEKTPFFPVEFFSHELMACDPSNADSVLAICAEWGIPYSPIRSLSARDSRLIEGWGWFPEDFRATAETDAAKKTNPATIISAREASLTVANLQARIKSILRAAYELQEGRDSAGDISLAVAYVNAGMAPERIFGGPASEVSAKFAAYDLMPHCLTNSICNQLAWTLKDSRARLKECACGTVFKYQSQSGKKRKATNPHKDSAFCCEKCRKDASNRAYYAEVKRFAQLNGVTVSEAKRMLKQTKTSR